MSRHAVSPGTIMTSCEVITLCHAACCEGKKTCHTGHLIVLGTALQGQPIMTVDNSYDVLFWALNLRLQGDF